MYAAESCMGSHAPVLSDDLPNAKPIGVAQLEQCELAMLVPSYGEQPGDILKQLKSVLYQDVDLSQIEVIYAVNNGPPNATQAWYDAYELNQSALRLPIFQNGRQDTISPPGTESLCDEIQRHLTVLSIDMSSPGNWVPNCNVGLVRQRLLGEAAVRFAGRERNGLLFLSDVDTYLDDPNMISKILLTFRDRPQLVAIPGAMTMEVDPYHPEGALIAANFERYKLANIWYSLVRTWCRQQVDFDPLRFYGPCSIVRSFEATQTGGFCTEDKVASDVRFGEKIMAYASGHNLEITHGRDLGIGVINALRLSSRTRNTSSHDAFKLATSGGPMMVANPLDVTDGADTTRLLDNNLLVELAGAVSSLPGGAAYVDHMLHRSFIASARIAS